MERKHDIKTLQPKFFECRSVCLDFYQLGLCQSTLGDAEKCSCFLWIT